MFIKNDTERRFFNGMIGEIVSVDGKTIMVKGKNDNQAFKPGNGGMDKLQIHFGQRFKGNKGDGGGRVQAISVAPGMGYNDTQKPRTNV